MSTLDPETAKVLLPNGQRLDQVSSSQLCSILMNLNIPGIDSSQGYQVQASIYAKFISDVHNAEGQAWTMVKLPLREAGNAWRARPPSR